MKHSQVGRITGYPESLPRRKNPIYGLRTHPLVCGQEETSRVRRGRRFDPDQVPITCRRIKQREPQLRFSRSSSESVFSCGQNRCQSGLSAVRVKAAPATPLNSSRGKMDRKRGHNWGTFSWAMAWKRSPVRSRSGPPGVSNILCKRRFVVLALGYSSAAVEAVRMWEAFFALHICIA
jgi:hypothetical protein